MFLAFPAVFVKTRKKGFCTKEMFILTSRLEIITISI